MDSIILRAVVALKITELERKFMPVLWNTQGPEDLKRSQKIIETSQQATREPEKPSSTESACHLRSVYFLKCNPVLFTLS